MDDAHAPVCNIAYIPLNTKMRQGTPSLVQKKNPIVSPALKCDRILGAIKVRDLPLGLHLTFKMEKHKTNHKVEINDYE